MINQNNRKPKQKTLDNVFSVVKAKAGMNRKSICSELNHTPYSVDLCLEVLVDSGKLLRRFIRMSGPYKVWAYEVK